MSYVLEWKGFFFRTLCSQVDVSHSVSTYGDYSIKLAKTLKKRYRKAAYV